MNKNKILSLAVVAFLSIPSLLMAASLGQVKTYSHLNEKLNAVIPVLSVLNKNGLTISIASFTESKKRGVQLSQAASKIKLSLYEKNGRVYIKATTKQKVRESYLNFIIKLKVGNSGSMSRKYAIFLDPVAKNKKGKKQVTTIKKPIKSVKKIASKKVTDFNKKKTKAPLRGVLKIVNKKGSTYGPIKKGETLWLIASKVRPAKSIAIVHMVAAIKQVNPKIQGSLEIGAIIHIPTIKGYKNKTISSKNTQQTNGTKKNNKKNPKVIKKDDEILASNNTVAQKTPEELELERLANEKLEKEKLEAAANLKKAQQIAKQKANEKKRINQEKIRQVEKAKKEKAEKEARLSLQKKEKEKKIALDLKIAKEKATALRQKKEQNKKTYMYGGAGAAILLLGGLFFYNKKRKSSSSYVQDDTVLRDESDIDRLTNSEEADDRIDMQLDKSDELNITENTNDIGLNVDSEVEIKEDTLSKKETTISSELDLNNDMSFDFEDNGLDLGTSVAEIDTTEELDFNDDSFDFSLEDTEDKGPIDSNKKDKDDISRDEDFNISSSKLEDMNITSSTTTDTDSTTLDSEDVHISLNDIEKEKDLLSLGSIAKEKVNLEKTSTHANDVSSKLKNYVEETKTSTAKKRATKVIPSMEINLARGFKSVGNLDGAKNALYKAIEFGNTQEVSEAKKLLEELI